ncbi:MAG: ATP-binding protein [Polyangiaceae bacterium]
MPTHRERSINDLAFLAGGGDKGERMRAFDWASTPLGPAAEWPQSLKAAVSALLGSSDEAQRAHALDELDGTTLRRILNVGSVGVLLFEEATGILLHANDFFFDMFGYDRADVAAGTLTWRTLTPAEYVAVSEAQMARLSATGHIGPYEKEYQRKDGSRSWMVFAGAALGDGTVVEYCIDVSERKRAEAALRAREDALRASEARLQRAGKAKDDFLGTLGHELRTPLAAITLWARVIRSGAVPPVELGRALDLIIDSAATQTRLVDDLLDLSRLASGKLTLTPIDVLVEDAARSAIELLHPEAEAKGVTLALEVAEPLGRAVLDVARLRQVLWNLLSNSIKFTAAGGAVTLKLAKSNGSLQVEVSDTGEGIPAEFMPHLFERFSQADMSVTRPHGGLGIGLALCRHLVELQSGTIEAHSAGPGRGATFRVRLPWVAPEPLVASEPPSRPLAAGPRPLTGVTVLLVEDDEHTLAGMRIALERAGSRVIAQDSAVATLATFEVLQAAGTPLLLVADMVLPKMSGYELIERITKLQRARGLPPIPACAVSGHARDDDRERAISAGFDMYLVKPVTPERLVEAVRDLTQIARVAGT